METNKLYDVKCRRTKNSNLKYNFLKLYFQTEYKETNSNTWMSKF